MSARLSVIFYIILSLEIGIFLTVGPWWPQGMLGLSDWGNNYFLLYAASKTGSQTLQAVVASSWVRGAVTGVGLLNLGIAFWEILHFKQTVQALQSQTNETPAPKPVNDATSTSTAANLPNHQRPNDSLNNN